MLKTMTNPSLSDLLERANDDGEDALVDQAKRMREMLLRIEAAPIDGFLLYKSDKLIGAYSCTGDLIGALQEILMTLPGEHQWSRNLTVRDVSHTGDKKWGWR